VNDPPVTKELRPTEPQSCCGHCGEEKTCLPVPGIKPQFFDRPARSLVAMPMEVSGANINRVGR
jgi:hypothetical protein